MKRTLVTGGTGFVGAALARRLVRDGHDVHLLVRRQHDPWRLVDLLGDCQRHEVDLTDEQRVGSLLDELRPDWVFHLAAYGAYSWQTDVTQIVRTNVLGTTALVQACLKVGVEAFVNAGSSSEYGFKDHAPAEREWLDPNSHYAVTKAFGAQLCRFEAQNRDVRMLTLRLYSVYGPYEDPRRLLPTLITHGLQGRLPPLVDKNVARDYVYVDDVVDAFLLAATPPSDDRGPVYNVGTGVQTSLGDVVEIARTSLGIASEPEWGSMPNRVWDSHVWVADNREIQARLGWKPRFTFEEGFEAMVSFLRHHPELLTRYRRQSDTGRPG